MTDLLATDAQAWLELEADMRAHRREGESFRAAAEAALERLLAAGRVVGRPDQSSARRLDFFVSWSTVRARAGQPDQEWADWVLSDGADVTTTQQ